MKSHSTVAMIICGEHRHAPFLYVKELVVGSLDAEGSALATRGVTLLSVGADVAFELFQKSQELSALREDISQMEGVLGEGRWAYAFESKDRGRYWLESLFGGSLRPNVARQVQTAVQTSEAPDQARSRMTAWIAESKERNESLRRSETKGTITTYAGVAKTAPAYATWLMQQYGALPLLHLRERKERIGKEEADALLRLKVTRGGPDRLSAVQRMVKGLLGVNVDAFQAEQRASDTAAEMDIDDFLVDANGAGIREALRLILDLELKQPKLILIEEPEVHLHPGLEHAIYGYLRDKSSSTQMFVTTHSTSFVD